MIWDGQERRQMSNVEMEVRHISERLDNELGSANGSNEGSVKKQLRIIQSDIKEIKEILVGDGKDNYGISAKISLTREELYKHQEWDKWLFIFIGTGQVIGLIKMFHG
jgi:hypothetical protein